MRPKQANIEWLGDTQAAVQAWLAEHPEHSLTSLVYNGLAAMGVEVEDWTLVPRRVPNGARKRQMGAG